MSDCICGHEATWHHPASDLCGIVGCKCSGFNDSYTAWITKTGERIEVRKMADSHLRYAIAKIRRDENWRKDWLVPLLNEQARRVKLKALRISELPEDPLAGLFFPRE